MVLFKGEWWKLFHGAGWMKYRSSLLSLRNPKLSGFLWFGAGFDPHGGEGLEEGGFHGGGWCGLGWGQGKGGGGA